MKTKVAENEKKSRSDGVLCVFENNSMRGIVCEENKIGRFNPKDILESYSNAIDILAQKKADSAMMPVTSLRVSFIREDVLTFELFSLVPTRDESTLASVKLWEGESINEYLACIAALHDAADECSQPTSRGSRRC